MGRLVALSVLLAATTARADTLALGPHGGVCLDCGNSDQMHWLGAIVEAEHALSPTVRARIDVAGDQVSLTSDECQFERTGTRLLASAGLRSGSPKTTGLFVALTAGALAVHQKTTCPRDPFDTFFGLVVRPQLGWDIALAPHRWVRLEITGELQWESDLDGARPLAELEGGAVFAFGD